MTFFHFMKERKPLEGHVPQSIANMSEHENKRLGTVADYVVLHGLLDELCRESRVERVDPGGKVIWEIVS